MFTHSESEKSQPSAWTETSFLGRKYVEVCARELHIWIGQLPCPSWASRGLHPAFAVPLAPCSVHQGYLVTLYMPTNCWVRNMKTDSAAGQCCAKGSDQGFLQGGRA